MNKPDSASLDSNKLAARLNADCLCTSLDRSALRRELERMADGAALANMIEEDRPCLLSDTTVYVSSAHIKRMSEIIAAIERVIALPAYQSYVLTYAPEIACHVTGANGVFFGYDFHIGKAGPQLIEINTNAGGGLLNTLVARAHQVSCECCKDVPTVLPCTLAPAHPEHLFIEMFRQEWRTRFEPERSRPLSTVAIVDLAPEQQYLYPEFLLFRQLFERHGVAAFVCDPTELAWHDNALWYGSYQIDLVYNRLTDFALEAPSSISLRQAYLADGAVITPHPRVHALYADKRNLVALSDDAMLIQWGVDAATRSLLKSGIPRTELIKPEQAEEFWRHRRQLFFKPATGYGSKAAYRGDKLTRRIFDEIMANAKNYVAQALVPPSTRRLEINGGTSEFKIDLRNYAYVGSVQLVAARLWQGQTTNFRSSGGGFSPVIAVTGEANCKDVS